MFQSGSAGIIPVKHLKLRVECLSRKVVKEGAL